MSAPPPPPPAVAAALERLSLPHNTTRPQLAAAWRAAALAHHPDVTPPARRAAATATFQSLADAYRVVDAYLASRAGSPRSGWAAAATAAAVADAAAAAGGMRDGSTAGAAHPPHGGMPSADPYERVAAFRARVGGVGGGGGNGNARITALILVPAVVGFLGGAAALWGVSRGVPRPGLRAGGSSRLVGVDGGVATRVNSARGRAD
ncbi:hypothetical protein MMPV_006936 [Pyropia vietnamensis]